MEKYDLAAGTSQCAQIYYEKLVKGINDMDLKKWEHDIKNAEDKRLHDRSVMDILGAKDLPKDLAAAADIPDVDSSHRSDTEWIQLALNIEEKQ